MNRTKKLSSLFTLVVFALLLSACGEILGDTDKYYRNAKQAVEATFNELPGGDEMKLKEAIKFKESDKLSDYQKNEFFKQLKNKNFNVTAKKAKVRDGYTEVTCDVTLSDGTVQEKKFKLYKEDDVWKVEIGFSEIRDAIFK